MKGEEGGAFMSPKQPPTVKQTREGFYKCRTDPNSQFDHWGAAVN